MFKKHRRFRLSTPKAVIKLPPGTSTDDAQRFAQEWRRKHGAADLSSN